MYLFGAFLKNVKFALLQLPDNCSSNQTGAWTTAATPTLTAVETSTQTATNMVGTFTPGPASENGTMSGDGASHLRTNATMRKSDDVTCSRFGWTGNLEMHP